MNKVIIGNWKMYPTYADSMVLAGEFRKSLEDLGGVEVVLAPPTPWLVSVKEHLHKHRHLKLSAQNIWPEDQGAFTGETSAYLLKDIINYSIIGHSERRTHQKEGGELLAKKVQAALRWNIAPILCIGEKQRVLNDNGEPNRDELDALLEQAAEALKDVSSDKFDTVLIAYEPIWAIGTSNPASPEYALKVIEELRAHLAKTFGEEARGLRFLYGGSVTSHNAADYLRHEPIAGLLIGSASVKASEFIQICKLASKL